MKARIFCAAFTFLISAQYALAQTPESAIKNSEEKAATIKRLENFLRCKRGTKFTVEEGAAMLRDIGLREVASGLYMPVGQAPLVFGKPIMAASVDETIAFPEIVGQRDFKRNLRVYYKNVPGSHFSKLLAVPTIDEGSDTDEPYYFRTNGKRNTIVIGGNSSLIDAIGIKMNEDDASYRTHVACVFDYKIVK